MHMKKGPHKSQFLSLQEVQSDLGMRTQENLQHIDPKSPHKDSHWPSSKVLLGMRYNFSMGVFTMKIFYLSSAPSSTLGPSPSSIGYGLTSLFIIFLLKYINYTSVMECQHLTDFLNEAEFFKLLSISSNFVISKKSGVLKGSKG